jgi:hypothetical protein
MQHIVDNYDNIRSDEFFLFAQGDPMHEMRLTKDIKTLLARTPNRLRFASLSGINVITKTITRETFRNFKDIKLYNYRAGRATFLVRGDVIKKRSKATYTRMYLDIVNKTRHVHDQNVPIEYELAYSSMFYCFPKINPKFVVHTFVMGQPFECYD